MLLPKLVGSLPPSLSTEYPSLTKMSFLGGGRQLEFHSKGTRSPLRAGLLSLKNYLDCSLEDDLGPDDSVVKEYLECRRHRRCGFDPWSGRSPGGGSGNALQYSCLESPVDGGAWRATVHGVAKSRAGLSR